MSNLYPIFKTIRSYFPQKSQFKFILLFILISFSLWTFTKLSNVQTSKISFPVELTNIPDLMIIDQAFDKNINLTMTSSGFDLLIYSIKNSMQLNLSLANYNNGIGSIKLSDQKFQIQKQLFEGTIINEIDPPILNFDYSNLIRKKVKVSANANLTYMSGYNKFGSWEIKPDSIFVSGPFSIVDSLKTISTLLINYDNINFDLNEDLELLSIHPQVEYDTKFVNINLSVKKYTEKTLSSPINIINLPDSLSIRLFPQNIDISFTIPLENAESISSNDFSFYCDFIESDLGNKDKLIIKLSKKPETVTRLKWEPKYVKYLIRE